MQSTQRTRALSFLVRGSLLLAVAATAQADQIGVFSGNGTETNLITFLTNNGHTVTDLNTAGGLTAGNLAPLDTVLLVRTAGNANLASFVTGGGLLITEWNASQWALTTANLLAATDNSGSEGPVLPVTFTAAGIAAGLSTGLANPYSDGGRTEFFRSFTGLGVGVDVLGTVNGGAANVIIGGSSGSGAVLLIGYDWADGFPVNGSASNQLILNALTYTGSAVVTPEPGSVALFGLGALGLAGFALRRRRAAARATVAA